MYYTMEWTDLHFKIFYYKKKTWILVSMAKNLFGIILLTYKPLLLLCLPELFS